MINTPTNAKEAMLEDAIADMLTMAYQGVKDIAVYISDNGCIEVDKLSYAKLDCTGDSQIILQIHDLNDLAYDIDPDQLVDLLTERI